MRRRILQSILAVVILTALLLGVPLIYTAWLWVEDFNRSDLQVRLDRMATEIITQEGINGVVEGDLDTNSLRLLTPAGGRLVVVYPTTDDGAARVDIGESSVQSPLVESLAMGTSGSLRLEVPSDEMRTQQRQAVGAVALLVLVSIAAGTVVAYVTAKRLADPLRDVANRAARLAEGDFRPDVRRHGIPELDRVSDVLDSATVEIAGRLQREHALVADVSHQLRSRLTAVRLRLDELSVHSDPAVVVEADEAMAQVDRLTVAIDELVRSSRSSGTETHVSVIRELSVVIADWKRPFEDADRELVLRGDTNVMASTTGSRLREAVAVLVDNALMHGAGTCTVAVRLIQGQNLRTPGEETSPRETMVCVEVSDEGVGVSNDLAPHIFDRGFSGAGSTGVGLALARALIEADGGRLELQRRRPALFAIFVPIAREHVPTRVTGTREPR
ncbi:MULTISPECIES: sensor histidine kinase [Rhodococcus]|uniref:sensor histidine kinase n=1 Tax=Rhodococcus TaxID=1827 RepID=UPI0002DE7DC5|nr:MULTISPECIES: HAMP domain-containing sensor histidine kinase [Rhodococcus]KXF52603.1 ATPase [Rhodococcus sp. SC4]RZK85614.1 MAG: HAMP domain-containing histidine kinase [Rhodococcus sp. (in: high G+C Gram-positive bacteria)]AHK30183.1 Signal transduction histidine-protein kinase ArlS [Rhodococcus opacus PD630]KXX55444.1 ATPase [Rhodococcus sp. LB1]PBC59149.1 sensor histidine kinase [Rhodococcus sp. ACPA1]